ncbi:CBS domain-containing protein [Fundidesulfovibrio butyratiphilus]
MLKAKDIMTTEVITLTPETQISQAAKLLLEKRINGCPVVDASGKVVGILCQSDLVAQQKRLSLPSVFTLLDGILPFSSMGDLDKEMGKIAAITVDHAMSEKPVTVGPDDTLEDVATLMVERGFHTLPVVKDDKLVGVIGLEDVLRTVAGQPK